MAYKVIGECNHGPVLWGSSPTYEGAVAIALESTGGTEPFYVGETLVWGDLHFGVFAQIEVEVAD